MTERLALDTNAAVEWLREGRVEPIAAARRIALPLPVIGELYVGAFSSNQHAENLAAVEALITKAELIEPDVETALVYGRIRAHHRLTDIRASKMNDLWIAALCLQHSLPLLTNDRGFDTIAGLAVIHW